MLMKKKKQWKQIAACALAATLTVSAFPASVMAASEQTNAQQQAEVIEQWDFDDAQTGLDGWENEICHTLKEKQTLSQASKDFIKNPSYGDGGMAAAVRIASTHQL